MQTIKQMSMLDRMKLQDFLRDSYEFLLRELDYYTQALAKLPGDIVAMSAKKRIDNDIQVIIPLLKNCQRYNLESLEKLSEKRFAYLLENRDASKDLLRKA
jgi:hypothetical protein